MGKRPADLSKIDQEWDPAGIAAKVRGGAIASQSSRDAALYTQMRILSHGRRVLASAGLGGGAAFMVPDGLNPYNVLKVYPDKTNERVMARQKCRLTPGYTPRVTAIFAPAGPTQTAAPDGMGFYDEDAGVAGVRCTVVIDNGITNVSKSITLVPKWSNEQYKGLPTNLWAALHTIAKSFAFAELKTPGWTENVTATITITALGGARVVEVSVSEEPSAPTQDDDNRECTIPSIAPAGIPSEYAITGKAYPDQAYWGSHQAAKSMRDQRQVCGPMLAYWTCWNEATATVGATEGVAAQSTGTSFVDILSTTITSWSADDPGWSMSSGGTARTLEQSGPLELRDVNAVVPVICRAYMKSGGGGTTATVRFQTETYSICELTTSSSTYAWVEQLAWMRCGVHQTDPSNLQVFIKSSNISFAASLAYLSVEYAGNYAVTV